jgi:hypothetical protein
LLLLAVLRLRLLLLLRTVVLIRLAAAAGSVRSRVLFVLQLPR